MYEGYAKLVLDEIEAITGWRHEGCPWRAFDDPVVMDAIFAHGFFGSGQLRECWGDDPPAHLPLAVAIHNRAVDLVQDKDFDDRLAQQRGGRPMRSPNPSLPDGGDEP